MLGILQGDGATYVLQRRGIGIVGRTALGIGRGEKVMSWPS